MTSADERAECASNAARLRDANVRVYIAATGAGAGIQDTLWRVPGCSSFLVGAAFPYHADQTTELLGFRPERFASEETAIELATAALFRAVNITAVGGSARSIGVGVTASVASLGAHRGDHRVHVAVVTEDRAVGYTLVLPKGIGEEARRVDGDASDRLGLAALFDAAGIAADPRLQDWTHRARTLFFSRGYWARDGRRYTTGSLPAGAPIFPGSFNPPHTGHFAIASTERGHVHPAIFAICATPPHKSRLTLTELLTRAKLLTGVDRLFTEGDPLYLDKSRRFPGHELLIGSDALLRMLDPKWGPNPETMLEEYTRLGTHFRVSGRVVDGTFVSSQRAIDAVPSRFRGLFTPVEGRWDISSTELRAAQR